MRCASTVISAPSPQDGRRPTFSAILRTSASPSSCAHLFRRTPIPSLGTIVANFHILMRLQPDGAAPHQPEGALTGAHDMAREAVALASGRPPL